MGMTLTVFFDDPFWIGVFERREGNRLTAAKVVFGAEPKDELVWETVLEQFDQLRFSPPVEAGRETVLAANPKRRQRQAAKARDGGAGTKSQQALQLAREENKLERKVVSKERREAEEERRLQLRIEKKKAKHRGH